MEKIENEKQYEKAVERIDELLRIVDDNTPPEDKNSFELVSLSNLVAEYEDRHYPMGRSYRG